MSSEQSVCKLNSCTELRLSISIEFIVAAPGYPLVHGSESRTQAHHRLEPDRAVVLRGVTISQPDAELRAADASFAAACLLALMWLTLLAYPAALLGWLVSLVARQSAPLK